MQPGDDGRARDSYPSSSSDRYSDGEQRPLAGDHDHSPAGPSGSLSGSEDPVKPPVHACSTSGHLPPRLSVPNTAVRWLIGGISRLALACQLPSGLLHSFRRRPAASQCALKICVGRCRQSKLEALEATPAPLCLQRPCSVTCSLCPSPAADKFKVVHRLADPQGTDSLLGSLLPCCLQADRCSGCRMATPARAASKALCQSS